MPERMGDQYSAKSGKEEMAEPISELEWPRQTKAAQLALLGNRKSMPTSNATTRPLSAADGRRTRRNKLIPVWEGREYQRHDEGERLVLVCEIHGPEWVRRYSRWSIRIGCCLTDEAGEVSYFMNMGNHRDGPRVGRQSNYYRAWTLANAGPPRKGEKMDPKIFLGKFFRARIEDCRRNSKDEDKLQGEVYSHITELMELVSP